MHECAGCEELLQKSSSHVRSQGVAQSFSTVARQLQNFNGWIGKLRSLAGQYLKEQSIMCIGSVKEAIIDEFQMHTCTYTLQGHATCLVEAELSANA